MNKEIKEILDFKENADYKKLSCDEIAILKDYITNLQQENERLELLNDELELYNIIKKAVEYIRQYDGHIDGYYYSKEHKRFLVEDNVKDELLDILNGKE